MQFEWDENKAVANVKKHGVSFEEAKSVFYDDYAVLFDDPDHSEVEDRFLIIGMSSAKGICLVSHCYRCEDERIRIISARKATRTERTLYENRFNGGE